MKGEVIDISKIAVGNITSDLVTQLKLNGQLEESKALLNLFHAYKKRQKVEEIKLIRKDVHKKFVKMGICTTMNCPNEPKEGYNRCEECYEKSLNFKYKKSHPELYEAGLRVYGNRKYGPRKPTENDKALSILIDLMENIPQDIQSIIMHYVSKGASPMGFTYDVKLEQLYYYGKNISNIFGEKQKPRCHCGTPLTGNQKLYCSFKCNDKTYNKRKQVKK